MQNATLRSATRSEHGTGDLNPAEAKEIIMRVIFASLLSLAVSGTHALASSGGGNGGGLGFLAIFFIAFGVLIVLFQAVPGLTLFLGMLKGVFSLGTKKPERAGKP